MCPTMDESDAWAESKRLFDDPSETGNSWGKWSGHDNCCTSRASVKNWKSISKLLKMCSHPFIGSCSYGVSMFSKFLNLDKLYCLQS